MNSANVADGQRNALEELAALQVVNFKHVFNVLNNKKRIAIKQQMHFEPAFCA